MNEEPASRWTSTDAPRGADYDARWERLASEGKSIHGEADFIEGLGVSSVLDAGCGTGRVAIELARRGLTVAGVDLDPRMLAQARAKAPEISWVEADLADVDLGSTFDCVALPGNVMIFLAPGSEHAVVQNLARHVAEGGYLVAGFQLGQGLSLDAYDDHCRHAGLSIDARHATWEGAPFDGGSYAVSVHRRAPV